MVAALGGAKYESERFGAADGLLQLWTVVVIGLARMPASTQRPTAPNRGRVGSKSHAVSVWAYRRSAACGLGTLVYTGPLHLASAIQECEGCL